MADSLRTVIVTTLAIGGLLTAVLVVRETRFAPEWLRPPATEPSPSSGTNAGAGAPALPPLERPAPTVTAAPSPPAPAPTSTDGTPPGAASVASATPEPSASAPQPVASASAGPARRPGRPATAQPAEPEVVELPADFRYSPQGPGNLTFPVAPATASTPNAQPR